MLADRARDRVRRRRDADVHGAGRARAAARGASRRPTRSPSRRTRRRSRPSSRGCSCDGRRDPRLARRAELPAATCSRCSSAARRPTTSAAPLRSLREAGFDNLSLDLIYGIPGQTADDLDARPRRGARARARAPLLLRARGEARDALHARPRRGARAAGRRDGGVLRARRRRAHRRRLPLVRDGELLSRARLAGGRDLRAHHNLALLAWPRLPRDRRRRRLDGRRRAAPQPPGLGALRGGARARRERLARRSSCSTMRRERASACCSGSASTSRSRSRRSGRRSTTEALRRLVSGGLVEHAASGSEAALALSRRGRFLGGAVTAELVTW